MEETRETFADRETYRAQQKILDEKKAASIKEGGDEEDKNKIGGGRKRSAADIEQLENKLAKMEAAVDKLKGAAQHPTRLANGAPPGNLGAKGTPPGNLGVLKMLKPSSPKEVKSKVQLALDSIDRSKHACLSMQRLATSSAQRCSELSTAFMLASAQYAEEANCLAEAKETLGAALSTK
jgi:hypothetical protein